MLVNEHLSLQARAYSSSPLLDDEIDDDFKQQEDKLKRLHMKLQLKRQNSNSANIIMDQIVDISYQLLIKLILKIKLINHKMMKYNMMKQFY